MTSRRDPRGRQADVEKREAARREREAFATVLEDLKRDYRIERQQVADWFRISPSQLSHMAKVERETDPTRRPPEGWRDSLAEHLRTYSSALNGYAAQLSPVAAAQREADHAREDDER